MRLARLLVPVLLLAVTPAARAQAPAGAEAVRAAVGKFVDSGDLAGAVAVVGRADGVLAHEAVGLHAVGGQPMAKDALFRIMSMTKPVTAIAVMILADEGRLAVADPVEKYLPEFKDQTLASGGKPSRPVAIRDLLTHTSGLPGGYPGELKDLYVKRDRALAEATAAAARQPLRFEPGAKWEYCNSGIDALGRVVEVVSGERFEDFLQKRVFGPLGMTDTTFYPTAEQMRRVPAIYDRKNGKLVPPAAMLVDYAPGARHPVPAGGLFSTGADLARLYRMMLNKGQLDGHRVLSEKAVAEMTRVQTGPLKTGFVDGMGFGYGWAVVREPKGVTGMLSAGTFGHGGAYGTQGWVDPRQDLFVVLLIQRTGLPNADGSPIRQALQEAAVGLVKR